MSSDSLFTIRYRGTCKQCGVSLQKYRPATESVQCSGGPCRVRCSSCGQINALTKSDS